MVKYKIKNDLILFKLVVRFKIALVNAIESFIAAKLAVLVALFFMVTVINN